MKTTMVHRFKVLGLLALPLIALAVVLLVMAWGHSGTQTTEAATLGNNMTLVVKTGVQGGICDSNSQPATPIQSEKCTVFMGQGNSFTLSVDAKEIPDSGYIGFQTLVAFSGGVTYKPATAGADEIKWPDSVLPVRDIGAGTVGHGSATAVTPPFPASTFKGNLINLTFTCDDAGTKQQAQFELISFASDALGAGFKLPDQSVAAAPTAKLSISCEVKPPTATPTETPTPIPIPQVQKLDGLSEHNGNDPVLDSLSNLFLTRQGTKIPPLQCVGPLGGNDVDRWLEMISIPISGPDPKGLGDSLELGAFEFEVHYDETKVCIELEPGDAAANMTCFIEDDVTKTTLEGVARLGCVTLGKVTPPDTETFEGRTLAVINVRPQPDVYSQAKPNQGNGVVVQLNNVGCDLGDQQGHAIAIFSCEDGDVTIRYLEGDVNADCEVNVLDTADIGFRWGSSKGSLIYSEFRNLEPSGTQADDDIDINDLQFVFGRSGSNCDAPHPAQPPVNPKL